MVSARTVLRGAAIWILCWPASCSCPSTANDDATNCDAAACDASCRDAGMSAGLCFRGECHCLVLDADADGDVGDAPTEADAGEDQAECWSDVSLGADAAGGECEVEMPAVSRRGGSCGVVCTRVSTTDLEDSLLAFTGQGPFGAFGGGSTRPQPFWGFDRRSRCGWVLDPLLDVGRSYVWSSFPSVDQDAVAYVVNWTNDDHTLWTMQIRYIEDLLRPMPQVIEEDTSARTADREPGIDSVALDHPWVVWRDVRESNRYNWDAMALNIETGERFDLSNNPDTGLREWDGVVHIDLLGTTAVFSISTGGIENPLVEEIALVDLATGERRLITNDPGVQWYPTITPHWIAWLDQRVHPSEPNFPGFSADVYGYNRDTGETRALVVAGTSMQGWTLDGEGDWLAYDDQRDGTDVVTIHDREQDIYALHLPTMTEVRVTDWPGFEMQPKVVEHGDGTYGVLLVEEIDYARATYRLWDCALPTVGE